MRYKNTRTVDAYVSKNNSHTVRTFRLRKKFFDLCAVHISNIVVNRQFRVQFGVEPAIILAKLPPGESRNSQSCGAEANDNSATTPTVQYVYCVV